jgi:magnesium-transporting ATPase (P-type)
MESKKFSLYTTFSIEQLLQELETKASGLDAAQVSNRLKKYGLNELKEVEVTWVDVLKGQLLSPFMCIFFVIGVAYLVTGKVAECIIIFMIIAVNVGIGFYQEYRSNMAMQALKKCLMSQVTVKREAQEAVIDINQLVPGDIIVLSAGDVIPADCRFIEVDNMSVDESSLTGESLAVAKCAEALEHAVTDMYKAENIGFTGTVVTQGKGIGVVIATGAESALGTLAALTAQVVTQSSLEKGSLSIAKFTLYLIFFSLLLTALVHIIKHKGQLDFVDFFLPRHLPLRLYQKDCRWLLLFAYRRARQH